MDYEQDVETHYTPRKSSAQWLQKLKSCDQETWDVLIRFYEGDLRGDILVSLRKRNLNQSWVDDIEQETWLTAIRRIQDFEWDTEDKFYHWLRIIALNHIRRYQRIEQRTSLSPDAANDAQTDESLAEFAEAWRSQEASVEETVILLEMYAALDKALRILKPREQEILLQWLSGKKPKELASMYQMRVGTVSMLLLRAKEHLRTHINPAHWHNDKD